MGRVIQTIQSDGARVTNVYFANGLLQQTCGSRTYPVAYTYDYAGRMKTMTTWTNFASSLGAAVTTWNYDGNRGLLTNKAYADGQGPSYAYTPGGRLQTRLWARGILTTYSYDNAGALAKVTYSDSTPGVSYAYDRLGRQIAVTNGTSISARTYNDVNEPLSESYTGGPLDGLSVTYGYDNLLRRSGLAAQQSSNPVLQQFFGYDAASRLSTVSDSNGNSATYSYLANSPLVGQIVFASNGRTVMTTTKQYDFLNRLTAINSGTGGLPVSSFAYRYNSANQRTQVTKTDSSYWVYQYDNLGQVISGRKYWANGTPVAGQQFTYNFDDIGNRQSAARGGDSSGAGLRLSNYSANSLNQYTSRDVPGYATVLGSANPNATVTVNLQRAVRQGSYFWDELPENNSGSPLYLSLTNLAVLNNGTNADIVSADIGNVFLSQTPEQFAYDADGNLTNDGRWAYMWDLAREIRVRRAVVRVPAANEEHPSARWHSRLISWAEENRLITMVANTQVGPQYQLGFVYDNQGRRIQKNVTNGVAVTTTDFLYDDWNLIAELRTPNSPLRTCMWGSDLSGTLQGSGGVDGLLEVSYSDAATTNCFPAFDGNGNVASLINAADGSLAANYEYGP